MMRKNPVLMFSEVFFLFVSAILQLQFFVGLVYASQSIYIECDYPLWMAWVGMGYGVTIITLFINFYIQAYIIKPKSLSAQQKKQVYFAYNT